MHGYRAEKNFCALHLGSSPSFLKGMHGHAMNVLEDLSVELVQGHSGYMYAWDKLYFCWLASFSVLTEITKS